MATVFLVSGAFGTRLPAGRTSSAKALDWSEQEVPGAMRTGFNLYRATPRDVADNEAMDRRRQVADAGSLLWGTAWPG